MYLNEPNAGIFNVKNEVDKLVSKPRYIIVTDFDKVNSADIRTVERFAKLYDVVVKDNPNASRQGLNLFTIRILFCIFAEDTDIFEKNYLPTELKS